MGYTVAMPAGGARGCKDSLKGNMQASANLNQQFRCKMLCLFAGRCGCSV